MCVECSGCGCRHNCDDENCQELSYVMDCGDECHQFPES